ncbi:MAG: hypothetical protein QME14_09825, partial [Methanobacteriaceae archaeon]|nr:hypothetical protein [Methanobacteriaceae archaeon]
KMRKIIGIFLCLLLVFSIVDVSFAGTYLGSTKNGWVDKEVYGNPNSPHTIVIIVGVHPREHQIHGALRTALISNSGTLSKKFILYRVHVTKDTWNYNKGRMNGQILANKYVVPDVKKIRPKLVVDAHENLWKSSGYKYSRFLDPISNNALTRAYISKIIQKMPSLKRYSAPGGSSPKYVTKPIAKKWISTIVYETYKKDPYSRKLSDANQLINALDKL